MKLPILKHSDADNQMQINWTKYYSYIHLSQDIKPNRELRREAPQLPIGFDVCPHITDYSYINLDRNSDRYSLPTKEIDIKNQELDVAARSAATSNSSLGREYL
ncbi:MULTISPECIES: hypothetical protein [Pseudanabaena]|uniref:Uncharacterized protein n=1 Tax=Pseudanabaena catenata USMAC16 TaxID=1855837 RepID=A0A9X4RJB0_9CYAN|nr:MULTISPECIES: hypothetical protein [Pseudanabaena]MDG3495810.1 hypothetical protein [Pseudanabaena catenata USMAC16]